MSTSISDKKDKDIIAEDGFELKKNASNSNENGLSSKKNDIEELRLLLVRPDEVSAVLPKAVRKSSEKDGSLAEATLPVVEENIRQSAARNPKILAEALFPVIGPAIRKAIAQALGSMVQSMNQTLEYSITPKGLSWRLEALRTGKSFGEIVILKTLLYRVEQVFLIHKETGLLLQHVVADEKEVQDADMVSAMLTAIEDFVQDSFKTAPNATLDSLKIKELSVWIEHSPDVVLAAVIRGNPPLRLRETFSEVIEEIHYNYETELKKFDGNADVFEETRFSLEKCLRFKSGEENKEKTFFSPMNVIGGILGLALLIGGFFYIRDYMRWSNYVARLKTEAGIVVAESDHGIFSHSISGLRDPLAIDPKNLLTEYGLDEGDVWQNWKSYYDTSPALVVRRAEELLKPPETIELSFQQGVLSAKGEASDLWISKAKAKALALMGVDKFVTGENTGLALKRRIESQSIFFRCSTDILVGKAKIDTLVKDIEALAEANNDFSIRILGFASKSGSVDKNVNISKLRGGKIKSELLSKSPKLQSLQNSNADFLRVEMGSDIGNNDCKAQLKVNLE